MPSECLRNRLICTWPAAPTACAAPGLDWVITGAWLHLRLQRPAAWLMLLLPKLFIWLVSPIWPTLVLRDVQTEAGDTREGSRSIVWNTTSGPGSRKHLEKITVSEDRQVPKWPSLGHSFFFFTTVLAVYWRLKSQAKPNFSIAAPMPLPAADPQRLQAGPHTRPRLSRTTSRSGLQTECSVLPKSPGLNPAEGFVGSAGTCRTCCSGQENNVG